MARRDYISDNLVDIRDRLKQYAKPTETTTDPQLDPAPSASAPAPVQAAIRPPAVRSEEFERGRRDLQGRIARDLAAVSAELELLGARSRELEKFLDVLNHVSGEFQLLSSAPDQSKALERLRIEYFQASGRAAAFGLHSGTVAGKAGEGAPVEKNFGRLFLEALPTGLFLLAGAVILALVLVFIFC